MDIKSIEVFDFLSYKHETLELPTDDIYLVVGENFTGKSNLIIDALTWCVFGVSRYKGDYVIREGADEAIVATTFELDGIEHVIITTKKRKGTVKVTCDDYKGNPTETKAYIQELLGLDYDTFSNSVCLEQGKTESFAKLSPKEAKELVIGILQLGIYSDYEQVAKQRLNKYKLDLDTYKSKLDALGDETAQIEDLESKIAGLNKKKLEKEKPLVTLNDQLVIQVEITDKAIEAVKKLEDKIYKIKVDKIAPIEAEKSVIRKNSNSISGLPKDCPTCKQKVTEEYKQEVADEYARQWKKVEASLTIAIAKLSELSKLEQEAKEKADKESTNLATINKCIADIGLEVRTINQDIQFITGELKGLEKSKAIVEDGKLKIVRLTKQAAVYQDLHTAFGRNGIPSYIVENSKVEMESIANDLLQYMEIELSIELVVQKELQKGGYGDTFEMMIEKNGIAKPFENYSGSEKILISFALRIALSVILSRRSGSKMQTLILDESAIFLDTNNTRQFIRGLKYVYKLFSFKKMIVITHDAYLKESFNNTVVIKIKNKISYIEE